MLKRKILFFALSLCFLPLLSQTATAQEFLFNTKYFFESVDANEPPQISGLDFQYPETARKNGVEGMLKATMTLGEDGKVRDLKILQSLPHGVEPAVVKAMQNFYFTPAKKDGRPVPITMNFDLIITAVYDENDKNIIRPQIIDKPAPVYPPRYAAEKVKGKVQIRVICYADGTVKVVGASSVMPKEFDEAAVQAAARLRFQPAVHKKSKADVSQKMIVEYDFK